MVSIIADMFTYSVVENLGFKHMVKVLEPHYNVPSSVHFWASVVPVLYKRVQAADVQELSTSQSLIMGH